MDVEQEAEHLREARTAAQYLGKKWGEKKLEWENWVILDIPNLDPIFEQINNLKGQYTEKATFMQEQAEGDAQLLKPNVCEDYTKRHEMTYLMSLPFRQKPKATAMVDYVQALNLSIPWVPDGRGANSIFAAVLAQLGGVPASYSPVMLRIQMCDYYSKNAETLEVSN